MKKKVFIIALSITIFVIVSITSKMLFIPIYIVFLPSSFYMIVAEYKRKSYLERVFTGSLIAIISLIATFLLLLLLENIQELKIIETICRPNFFL